MGPMNQPPADGARRSAGLRRPGDAGRGRRRRGFWLGLLAGALAVVALDYGGEWALRALQPTLQFRPPPGMSLRSVVFIGMVTGIALTGVLILLTLGWSGASYVLGPRRTGPLRALLRGARRLAGAAWALGLTLGVVGGTAWFLIPRPERGPTADYLRTRGEEGLRKGRGWIQDALPPPAEGPPPPAAPP